jgi:hypothetical protein
MTRPVTLACLLALSACAAGAEPPPVPPASPPPPPATAPPSSVAAAPPAAPAVPAEAEPAAPPPLEIAYPFTGIATIPDDCAEPSVTLTTAPKKMGWDYDWTWTRQALLANPQFQIVDWPGKPDKSMAIRLDMYEIPEGFALVAVCHDGATCNKLAAMYRSTVQTCNPQLHCGALPIAGTPRRSAIVPADGRWLPLDDANVVGRCARIGVCLRVEHERFRGNPGVACQSAPAQFKVDCAKKPTCGEVVQCLR